MPFLESVSAASGDDLPYGYEPIAEPDTWTDQWSWNASGVPTVCTSAGGPEYDRYYHTDLENAGRVDHEYIGGVAKWNYRVIQGLDEGVLPYDMSARGDQLIGEIQAGKLVRAGVGKKAATGLTTAATEFRAAAWQWELRKAATPAGEVDAVNEELLALQEDRPEHVHEPRPVRLPRLPARRGGGRRPVPDEGDQRGQGRQRGARPADAELVRRASTGMRSSSAPRSRVTTSRGTTPTTSTSPGAT